MEDPVAAQLEAYNRQDVDAFCACYADDVVVEDAHGKRLFEGVAAMRDGCARLFEGYPANRAEILSRIRIGPWVIDEERVTGRDGPPLHAVAIYEVRDGLIKGVCFLAERD